MGFFDYLKKRLKTNLPQTVSQKELNTVSIGKAVAEKIEVDVITIEKLRKKIIAFDVETTGLNAVSDRIVEIGAVMFEDGIPTKTFGTLVNPNIRISPSASSVNHITNAMLYSAPIEKVVYRQLIEFLGEAINGEIIMCAHNARFDFSFLCNTLSRLGYDANIRYVDTLSLSRKYIKGLTNYKQITIESYFGLKNDSAHRAESDAEICGKICFSVLDCIGESLDVEIEKFKKLSPSKEELEVCAFIQNIIIKNGHDNNWIRFKKNSNNYVDVICLYTFLKFKFAKKGKYMIIEKSAVNGINLITENCTESEGGMTYARLYFNSPFDLELLSDYIYGVFIRCYNSMNVYINMGYSEKNEAEKSIRMLKAISYADMDNLLLDARNREYDSTMGNVQVAPVISRSDVIVNAIHTRVTLDKIRNATNWEKGFDDGYPYWERGEIARKDGRINEAIDLFDKARYNGYNAPALYGSYAKAYRKNKDYDNEIVILEEGIVREINTDVGVLEARRDKAIKLQFLGQNNDRKIKGKIDSKDKIKVAENIDSVSKQSRGRVIMQLDDEGIIIKEFETISSAAFEIGVSSKSIRDAANGVQKHAGGYCWKFKE